MEFVPLTRELLQFRVDEDAEAVPGWFEDRIDDYIRIEPTGCLALIEDGHPIGMVTTVCCEQTGWLGWLYVSPSKRNHGLGERLMRRAMEYVASRGCATTVLEAVVEAIPLYERLGFVRQFTTQHYQITSVPEYSESGFELPILAEFDLDSLIAFDRRFFHENRRRVFEAVLRNARFRGFVATTETGIAGYIGGTDSGEEIQVGPLVVDPACGIATEVVAALVRGLAAGRDVPLHLRCPLVEPDRAEVLEELGARRMDYHTVRMYRGEAYPLEGEGALSLGCPGKG